MDTVARLRDDSAETKRYYQEQFAHHEDKTILNTLLEILDAWSEVAKTGKLSPGSRALFETALRHSHEYVWYEAGQRLTRLIPYSEDTRAIFYTVFADSRWQSRFNVVALARAFDAQMATEILTQALGDKSTRVREKAADVILSRQDRRLLGLLKDRLRVEKSQRVIAAIKFTLDNFDRVRRDEHGHQVLCSNDIVE